MALLQVRDLEKSYDGVKVLRGINLDINTGDVIAVIGPSGAGKTTLLRCMNLLETADRGELVLDGASYDLTKNDKKEKMKIHAHTGFVFQGFNLFSNKTALGNVTLGLTSGHKMKKDEAEEIGMRMLKRVGMDQMASKYPGMLSGGQQQRVAIARALATDPKIIYFDEPTSALDPKLTGEVLAVMKDLAGSGITMMVVTHELSFAKEAGTRVVFMENGTITEEGLAKEFFENPRESTTKAFLMLDGDA
ncbi:MAG: amino acid ABC transporter ATP-binding protein [Lachnospiraceae bacterium]|nr:amino acid ABC transporter ATP-binding protein [Lachnospiraceae bacterium]